MVTRRACVARAAPVNTYSPRVVFTGGGTEAGNPRDREQRSIDGATAPAAALGGLGRRMNT